MHVCAMPGKLDVIHSDAEAYLKRFSSPPPGEVRKGRNVMFVVVSPPTHVGEEFRCPDLMRGALGIAWTSVPELLNRFLELGCFSHCRDPPFQGHRDPRIA